MSTPRSVRLIACWISSLAAVAIAARAFAATPDSAADHASVLAGVVVNKNTGDRLEGATVRISGTEQVVSTARGGSFAFPVAPGTYVLEVNFTGLEPAHESVTVGAGETTHVEVPLTAEYYRLEKFTVKGLREGNALAIEMQRAAANAKTVVATDAHGTPASNPGELLGRIPGVAVDWAGDVNGMYIRGLDSNFISIMIDGNNFATSVGSGPARSFNLRALGTSNIATAEVVRAPLPDMPANAVAGFVNLTSARAFDNPGRVIDFSVGTQWIARPGVDAPHRDRPGFDQFTLRFSDVYSVWGGQNNLGISLTGSQQRSIFTADGTNGLAAIGAAFVLPTAANGLSSPLRSSFGAIDYYDEPVTLRTLGLSIDYKLSESTYLYFKNTFNENGHKGYAGNVRWSVDVPNNAASFAPGSTYNLETALPSATSTSRILSTRSQRLDLSYAMSTGFEHKMMGGSALLSADFNFSTTNSFFPSTSQVTASMNNVGWQLDRTAQSGWFPAFRQTAGPSIYDANNYTPTTNFRATFRGPAQRIGFRSDFKKTFDFGVPVFLKTGIRFEEDSRRQDTNRSDYTYIGPAGFGPYVGETYAITAGKYGPFPFFPLPTLGGPNDIYQNRALWTQTAADAYNSVVNTNNSDSEFDEKIAAAYVMGGITLGKLKITSGVRVERTETEGKAYQTQASAAAGTSSITTLTPEQNAARARLRFAPGMTTTEGDYANVFPGVHFVYEPMRKLLLRASYNKSISRPVIASLLPTNTVNDDTRVITAGNPALKPFTSDNFEVAVQKYFEPVGMFEASVFLKEIKNYTRTISTVVGTGPDNGFDGQYGGYTLNSPLNTGNARIRGFELSYQQQYTFLPGFFRGFGSFANFSYTQAQGDFGTTTFQKRLGNQRPRTANAGISYVAYGLQARLLANWQDSYYITGAGATSVYADPRTLVDLKTQYRISSRYEVYFDVLNMTNEFTRTQVLEGGLKYDSLRSGVIYRTGVKLSF